MKPPVCRHHWTIFVLLAYLCYLHSAMLVERHTLFGQWQAAWTTQAMRHWEEDRLRILHACNASFAPERRKWTKPIRFPWQR